MKFRIILFLMGFVFFLISSVNAEVLNYTTYYDYTEKYETVGWDPAQNAEYYEFEAFHYEQKVAVLKGSTSQTQVVVNFPRSGHYVFRVRSCTSQSFDDNGNDLCSTFAESINIEYGTVDGQPKGWWVFRHTSPPGDIVTE